MKKQADVTLLDEVSRNWEKIAQCDYLFDRREKMIDLLEACEKEEMINHITSIVSTESGRKSFPFKRLEIQME